MSNQHQSYILGSVEIHGPTASEKRCSIFINLAKLFNTEYTSDAVEILKLKWKETGKKGKLDIDAESDYVSILTSKSAIVDLAILINDISSNKYELNNVNEARNIIKGWKQPEPYAWEIGDIFTFQLNNGSFAYGQVLDKTYYNAPTCLLFSYKSEEIEHNIKAVINSKPISILHVHDDHLNDGAWKVIGNTKAILPPGSGPCGVKGAIGSTDWDGLEILANAWFGLKPWNEYYKEDYLDKYLLSNVTRPENAIFLNKEELEALGVKRPEWNQST